MVENINFNDTEVQIEIIDSVLGKIIVTDFLQLDNTKLDYLKNRDKIATVEQLNTKQDVLTAGANIVISEDNVISAELNIAGVSEFISADEGNDIVLGSDGKLFARNTAVVDVDGGSVMVDANFLENCTFKSVGNLQLRVKFRPVVEITRENTPLQVIVFISGSPILPLLPERFGQIWDSITFESVGFCELKSSGELTINVISNLSVDKDYIILV